LIDHRHQPVNRKSAEIGIPHAREIRRGDAGESMRFPDAQAIPVEGLDDFGGQDRLEPLNISAIWGQTPLFSQSPKESLKMPCPAAHYPGFSPAM
jgi:hypothetical protein